MFANGRSMISAKSSVVSYMDVGCEEEDDGEGMVGLLCEEEETLPMVGTNTTQKGVIEEENEEEKEVEDVESANAPREKPKPPPPKQPPPPESPIEFADTELLEGYFYYHTNLLLSLTVTLTLILYSTLTHAPTSFIASATLVCAYICILYRWEPFINGWYWVITRIPKSSCPVKVRQMCARYVSSLGGCHTGFAVGTIAWVVLMDARIEGRILLAMAILLLVMLVGSTVFALVKRATYHNLFEQTHRWFGWMGLVAVWAFVLDDGWEKGYDDAGVILRIVVVSLITFTIFHPWIRIRKIPIEATVLSTHAIKLQFNDAVTQPGQFGRIAHSPLSEWHSFAVISADRTTPSHSMVIAGAGDWTKDLIANPPTEMYVRGTRTCGFMNTVNMFQSVILVATGAGIAPVIPFLLQAKERFPMVKHVIWTTKRPLETFGEEIVGVVLYVAYLSEIYEINRHNNSLVEERNITFGAGLRNSECVIAGDIRAICTIVIH